MRSALGLQSPVLCLSSHIQLLQRKQSKVGSQSAGQAGLGLSRQVQWREDAKESMAFSKDDLHGCSRAWRLGRQRSKASRKRLAEIKEGDGVQGSEVSTRSKRGGRGVIEQDGRWLAGWDLETDFGGDAVSWEDKDSGTLKGW